MSTRTDPPVSSRTLRRTEKRIQIELDALRNQIIAQRSETGERLAEIERLLAALTDCLRIPLLPRWTEEQLAAYEAGEGKRLDRMLREGFRAMANGGSKP